MQPQLDSCTPIPGGFGLIYKEDAGYGLYTCKAEPNVGIKLPKGKKMDNILQSTAAEDVLIVNKLASEPPVPVACTFRSMHRNRRQAAFQRNYLRA